MTTTTPQAATYERARAIRIGDCTPLAPGDGQVQLRVSHCGICGTDLHIFLGHMDQRVATPRVIGHEMAGTVEAVGPNVRNWKRGDRVTVRPLDACGACPACAAGHAHICMNLRFLGIDTPGAMQGLWTVPAHTLHRLPDALAMAHGAMIEPLAVAVHDVRLGGVAAGEYVVVQGGGPIGMLVALVAQRRGARVLVTEVNDYRIALARSLGFDAVNPARTDAAAHVADATGGAGADVVFEVSGSAAGAELMTKLPRTRGRLVVVAIHPKPTPIDLFRFFWRELKLCGARVYEPADFDEAIALAASGAIPLQRLVTDVLPLERVADGFATLERGGEAMKVLVRCS